MVLPLASMVSMVFTIAPPAVIAERDATEAKPGISLAESPWRCTTCSAGMPSRSATTRGNTVAWPWPVDCTLSTSVEVVAAGKLQRRAFERRAAGMLEHAGDAEPAQLAALERLPCAAS